MQDWKPLIGVLIYVGLEIFVACLSAFPKDVLLGYNSTLGLFPGSRFKMQKGKSCSA